MAADRDGSLEARLIEAIDELERAELRDLVDRVDADAGAVFACARRLERHGVIVSPRPGAYELAESDLDALLEEGRIAPEEEGNDIGIADAADPAEPEDPETDEDFEWSE